jgi:hypothetical protein
LLLLAVPDGGDGGDQPLILVTTGAVALALVRLRAPDSSAESLSPAAESLLSDIVGGGERLPGKLSLLAAAAAGDELMVRLISVGWWRPPPPVVACSRFSDSCQLWA